jgi:hypothetical protein
MTKRKITGASGAPPKKTRSEPEWQPFWNQFLQAGNGNYLYTPKDINFPEKLPLFQQLIIAISNNKSLKEIVEIASEIRKNKLHQEQLYCSWELSLEKGLRDEYSPKPPQMAAFENLEELYKKSKSKKCYSAQENKIYRFIWAYLACVYCSESDDHDSEQERVVIPGRMILKLFEVGTERFFKQVNDHHEELYHFLIIKASKYLLRNKRDGDPIGWQIDEYMFYRFPDEPPKKQFSPNFGFDHILRTTVNFIADMPAHMVTQTLLSKVPNSGKIILMKYAHEWMTNKNKATDQNFLARLQKNIIWRNPSYEEILLLLNEIWYRNELDAIAQYIAMFIQEKHILAFFCQTEPEDFESFHKVLQYYDFGIVDDDKKNRRDILTHALTKFEGKYHSSQKQLEGESLSFGSIISREIEETSEYEIKRLLSNIHPWLDDEELINSILKLFQTKHLIEFFCIIKHEEFQWFQNFFLLLLNNLDSHEELAQLLGYYAHENIPKIIIQLWDKENEVHLKKLVEKGVEQLHDETKKNFLRSVLAIHQRTYITDDSDPYNSSFLILRLKYADESFWWSKVWREWNIIKGEEIISFTFEKWSKIVVAFFIAEDISFEIPFLRTILSSTHPKYWQRGMCYYDDGNKIRNKILLQTIENRYPKHYEDMLFSSSKNQLTQYAQPPILSKQ